MKRNILKVMAALVFILILPVTVFAAQILVNGQQLSTYFYFDKGNIIVPMRAIFEALGAPVFWDAKSKTVSATKQDTNLYLKVGSKVAYVNGHPVVLDVPSQIIKGATLVPLRFVSESLGSEVAWNGSTKTVTILDRATASNQAELSNAIKKAFDARKTTLKLKASKDFFNSSTVEAVINQINQAHQETNYYIAKYNYKTKSLTFSNSYDVDFTFEYKDVIADYNIGTDTDQNAVAISSNDDLTRVVKAAMENTTEKIKYKVTNKSLDYSVNALLAVVEKVAESNRGNYVDTYGVNSYGLGGYITINYIYDAEKIKHMKTLVNNQVAQIVKTQTSPDMTQLEKEKALHDYLVLNTRYDTSYNNANPNNTPKESYTAYGALINGVAVCEGYATAMDLLLKQAGIESKIITGTADNGTGSGRIAHAWNMVKIDGTWYYLDATWDDPVPDIPGHVSYKYFNVSEEKIRQNHFF